MLDPPANIYFFKVSNRDTRKRNMFKDNNKNTRTTSLTSLEQIKITVSYNFHAIDLWEVIPKWNQVLIPFQSSCLGIIWAIFCFDFICFMLPLSWRRSANWLPDILHTSCWYSWLIKLCFRLVFCSKVVPHIANENTLCCQS